MQTAMAAAYQVLRSQLVGSVTCGDRVYAELAPAGVEKPYIVVFSLAGGEIHRTQTADASLLFGVKCVAKTMGDAMDGAGWIKARLNDRGRQDDAPLPAVADWYVTTTTEETAISLVEMFEGAQPIYHQGAQYRLIMEAK